MARLLIAIQDGDGWILSNPELQGQIDVEAGGLVVPFSSWENAADCFRIVANALKKRDVGSPIDNSAGGDEVAS
jgi:hypothetical protein